MWYCLILMMEELPPPGTHKILEIMGKTTYQLVSRIFSINVRWFPSCFSLSFVGKPFVPKGDIQILSATQGAAKRLLCVHHKSRETPLLKSDLLTNSWVFWIFLLSKVILSLTTLSISKMGTQNNHFPFFQGAMSARRGLTIWRWMSYWKLLVFQATRLLYHRVMMLVMPLFC